MKRSLSQPLTKYRKQADYEHQAEEIKNVILQAREEETEDDQRTEQVSCMTLYNREPTRKRGGKKKTVASRLEKQLKSRWALEELIDEQLAQFEAHYSRAMGPTRPSEIAQLLKPKQISSLELASLTWLGDWRPSSILGLIRSLAQSSSPSLSLSDSIETNLILSRLIHEMRIEEAVIDEEMAEIQSTCILHMPFGRKRKNSSGTTAMGSMMFEFEKIHRVVSKAQSLRFKAMELAVKKVLSQTEAAEFLVAFAGIQDFIRNFCRSK